MDETDARRVVISYPDELGEWSRDQLTTARFKGYLRRVHDEIEAGTTLEEFVDVGCCGASPDIPLRVESVEGPGRLGPETAIEFVAREGEATSGWEVQSRAGPPKRS
jgi:hypothetical protein